MTFQTLEDMAFVSFYNCRYMSWCTSFNIWNWGKGSLDLAAIPHVDLAYKIKIAIEMNMQKQPNTIILKKQTPKEE
ncbi:unnamed protein product, partial [Vitis vinifera]|uniref:Uncharacterized protein n=1 Tax=Vitis vinifera TaxID=29760 RepID=D7T7C3_VITVI